MTSKLGKLQYEEPPMFLQRPTSGSSQDVTHILASTFRDLFTRDFVEQESVRNLNKSRTGEDSYHEKYVEELRKVQVERERRMAEAAMLERHIMQARAKSMAEDERELNKVASDCDVYHDLGLPPVQSSFKHCLDSNLLRKHGLIVPEDFSTQEPPLAHAPKAANQPHYAEATQTSTKRVMSADKEHAQVRQDHALEIQRMMAQKSKKKVIKKEKWQETLTPETREMHRKDLTIVYKKSDFLRNPRHRPPSQTEGKRSLIKANTVSHQLGGAKTTVIDEGKDEPSIVFLATPSPLVFSTYQVGHVYEALLNLKNVSAASRPLRVRPPKSQHFAVGLGKFPGEQGMVAPGMSCQYNIRFMPDSLMNFEDELIIQTQSSQPLTVKLLGQRAPPILTLSSVIDCGFCLIGGEVTREFIVKNEGGSGRFCAMPRDCWPASSFKSVSSGDKTELPPFVIQPAMFELQAGHAISLYVTFMPREAALFEKSITIVCDNCTVKHFSIKGIGQTAGVLLKSVTGGESPPSLGDLQDISAQHHIKFTPVNPLTMDTKHIVIQNTTNVELPYYWQSLRPVPINPKPKDTSPEEEESPSNDEMLSSIRQPDSQLVFHVNPQNGILPPGGKVKAAVCFAPPEIGSFISVLQLILQNIPSIPDSHDQSLSSGEKLTHTPTPSKKHSQPQAQPLVDTSALEIEVRGECKEFDVTLHPYAIIVPGQILVSTTVRKQLMMTNYSQYPAFFKWDTVSDCHIIEIQPNQGQIPGRSTIDLEATITGGRVGHLEKTVLCHIESQPKPLALKVHATIKGPSVVIDTSAIDFGLIQFGSSASAKVVLRNESQVAASFKLRESPEFVVQNPSTGESQSELILSKEGGELAPLGSEVISVIFRPLLCRKISSVMECIVRDGSDCFIPVRADVQRPQACLLNCMITLQNAFRGVPTQYHAVLINQTLLPTKFEWQKSVGPEATSCEITLEPSHGILQPHEELKILVTLVADLEGHISNLLVPCSIEGMKHPVVMSISGEVKGLKVTYTTPKEENTSSVSLDDLISIDFGTEVEVGSTPSRIVLIQNHTAITAPFSIALEYFVAGKPPTPPESHKKRVDSPKRRGLLAPTANLADPKSKSSSQLQADYTKAILRENNGIAFTVEPATGILQPFETLTVKVTAFSDMWGSYSDRLVCKVSDLAPVVIPVKATVIGCPLKFQMATLKGQIPVVRFGTHVCGVPPVQRPLKIVNNSPCDLRIDWRLFNLLEGDPAVLDLIVNIGNSFPLLDENGEEVEPPVVDYHTPQNTPKDVDDTISESTFGQSQRAVDNNLLSHITEELEREAERKTSMEKLVSVQLKEHEGNPAEGPFSINKNQLIVPARNQVGIVTYFTPDVKYLSSLEATDCVGYALGYLSLVKETDKQHAELVKRAETFDVDPLRLDFTANMKPAILKIETSEEEGMVYRTAASRLLQPTVDSPQWTLHPSHCPTVEAIMTNGTQTPLQFQLLAQEPFFLANLDPVPKRPGESRQKRRPFEEFKEDEMITLPSQKNAEISVAFRLTLDLINQSLHELQPDTEKDGLCLTSNEGERKLHVRKDLDICYNNGTVQKLPLYAVVTLPSLVITPEKLDFGTCLVGQQRSLEVTITNSTASASFWKGYLCSQDPTDDRGLEVFNISPSLGYLEAHVTHVSQSKAILKILFTARHDVSYEGVFLFSGLLGEETRKLTVTGQGSYDNRHEALVNV
ncbi:Deleted in lung and esophageal cancer protein 1 [Holothuria leucospilota]|uniref:Deleted in lung and esophageal cancer protein 1 n=1 Tax=Holothuria leucospilota TaxID=206669 RepID=A0A9Q0YRU7_HOLLE|nr:Deleted in lung and esophageal cancer protein 1 [Holothuria leucospilota]